MLNHSATFQLLSTGQKLKIKVIIKLKFLEYVVYNCLYQEKKVWIIPSIGGDCSKERKELMKKKNGWKGKHFLETFYIEVKYIIKLKLIFKVLFL